MTRIGPRICLKVPCAQIWAKKSKMKCPKWPIVIPRAWCYKGGLSLHLNHLKIGFSRGVALPYAPNSTQKNTPYRLDKLRSALAEAQLKRTSAKRNYCSHTYAWRVTFKNKVQSIPYVYTRNAGVASYDADSLKEL